MVRWMLLSWGEGKWEINGMWTSGLEGMLDPQTNTPYVLSKTSYMQVLQGSLFQQGQCKRWQ